MRLGKARVLAWLLACGSAAWSASHAQTTLSEPPAFKPEEIEALVAPIALYPDALLSQVLMASTYPLEVVQAARWVKAHREVKGEAAVKAVEGETWDVSVKSLVAFPQVLEPMDEKLDWTQKLGDAFLADQTAVLDAVQRLRKRAEEAGNLKSNEQQKVTAEQTAIAIEPANPEVIYVPVYNPTVVYGVWYYPAYPPYYWPPPPYYYPHPVPVAGFYWGVGIVAGAIMFGGCRWGGYSQVTVNVNRAAHIDRNFDRGKVSGGDRWQHDASHRQGVAYRDSASRERYGKDVPGADARRDYRGRDGGAGDRAGAADRGGPGDRAGPSDRGSFGDSGRGGRDNAFEGIGGGSSSQRDFDRGRASNQSMGASRGGGFSGGAGAGGMRGGGGGGRGGGGRR